MIIQNKMSRGRNDMLLKALKLYLRVEVPKDNASQDGIARRHAFLLLNTSRSSNQQRRPTHSMPFSYWEGESFERFRFFYFRVLNLKATFFPAFTVLPCPRKTKKQSRADSVCLPLVVVSTMGAIYPVALTWLKKCLQHEKVKIKALEVVRRGARSVLQYNSRIFARYRTLSRSQPKKKGP